MLQNAAVVFSAHNFFLDILTLKVAGGKAEDEFHVELPEGSLGSHSPLGKSPISTATRAARFSQDQEDWGLQFAQFTNARPSKYCCAMGPQVTRPFELQLSPAQMSWLWWMWIQRRMVGQSICCLELFFPNPSATKVQVQAPAAQIYGIQIESIHVFFWGGLCAFLLYGIHVAICKECAEKGCMSTSVSSMSLLGDRRGIPLAGGQADT